MTKYLAVFLVLLAAKCTTAQDLSNKGKEFWLAFPAHVDATQAVFALYITSDKAATGQVQFAGNTIPFSIAANGLRSIFLGPGGVASNAGIYQGQLEGILANSGVHVTADVPVVVYAHIIRQARSGSTLALPTGVWGRDYVVPSYSSQGASGANSGYPSICVIAKEANTVIEITPTQTSRDNSRQAGVPYTITLSQPGDVYQVQFRQNVDISGTVVKSIAAAGAGCKPIGVFSATTWTSFDCPGQNSGDNLFQQLLPTRSFGRKFLTAPFKFKQYDILRVFVLEANTVVTRTVNGVTSTLTGLAPGGYYEFRSGEPNLIEADKPVTVVQYMTVQGCDGVQSDPEMILLTPVEQSINNITVFNAHRNGVPPGQSNVNRCLLNIIIKKSAAPSFRINNQLPVSPFTDIPGTEYAYVQEEVTANVTTDPITNLTADSGFNAIAYGYGNFESYGYNAGTNVRDLFQFVSIRNEFATVNFPATCVNTPFKFSMTLPYRTTRLEWKFNGLFPDEILNNPTPDSSYVLEGQTLYVYRLTKEYKALAKGIYPIKVIAVNPTSDGCEGEQEIDYDLTVTEQPAADFTIGTNGLSGCLGDTIRLTDASKTDGVAVTKYTWNFGDGSVDSVRNPAKVYGNPGTFTIRQTLLTEVGCFSEKSKTVTITPPPVAKFSISSPACEKSDITLTDQSTTTGGTLAGWKWSYPGGNSDSLGAATARVLRFDTLGNYPVSLQVVTAAGCRSPIFTDAIRVKARPNVDFIMPAGICLPNGAASFTNQTKLPAADNSTLGYLWNFGDGATSTVLNPVHNYKSSGPFNVSLQATSSSGCVASLTKNLNTVFDQPKANWTIPASVCQEVAVTLQDNSSYGNGQTGALQIWQVGNAKPDTINNPSLAFANAGTNTLRHWVVSDKGCISDTITGTIKVNANPVNEFSLLDGSCVGRETIFVDISSSADGTINRRWWSLGDGTAFTRNNNSNFTHVYANAGTYTIRFYTESSLGCKSDTLVRDIATGESPKANFVLPEVCLNDAFAQFTNSSTATGNIGLSYQWNFGDPLANAGNPNTSTNVNGRHRYSQTGVYPVRLIAITALGCRDTLQQQLTVNGDKPSAAFTVNNAASLCANTPVVITNNSTVNFGAVTRVVVYWNWPNATDTTIDESPSAGKNYQHLYPDFNSPVTRNFSIRLVAFSGGVCSNEVIRTITLNASPNVVFGRLNGICSNAPPRVLTEARDASALNAPGTYFGTGVSAGSFNPAGLVAGNSYTIGYAAVSTVGCRDTGFAAINVLQLPVADIVVESPACEGKQVLLNDNSTAAQGRIVTWNWNFGDGSTASRNNGNQFSHVFPGLSSYPVQLTVVTDSGCTSLADQVALAVNVNPVAAFTPPSVCLPEGRAAFSSQTTIADGTQGQLQHRWNFGDGATGTGAKAVHFYKGAGPFTATLLSTSTRGCSDTAIRQVTNIYPQAMANFSVTPSAVCVGDAIQFADISNALGRTKTAFAWQLGNGQSRTDAAFTYTYPQAGTYNVSFYYATDVGCFSDTITKQVGVHPYPNVNAGPDRVVLEGGQVLLAASVSGGSNYTYLWSPATWLSDPAILQPVSSPTADITYKLTVTSEGGCANADEVRVTILLKPEIPSAFSPNGDGINDVWNIRYLDSYPGATVQVFDRYGRAVFSSVGYNTPWNGTLNGNGLPAGVYYYIVNPKNGRSSYTGSVTILK